MSKNSFSPRKMIGVASKVAATLLVLVFLGVLSLNFFQFFFYDDQWFFGYLGFGLTSGGVLLYMGVLKFDADSPFKRTLAVVMMAVCLLGELATAGFGMQIQQWIREGATATPETVQAMVIAVQVLGLFHGLMLLLYYAGDDIITLFQDEDQDGIPNLVDPDWKRNPTKQSK